MSEFRDLLVNTLRGVNDDFNAALADLQQVVKEADEAVKAISPELSVRLVEREKGASGTRFLLVATRESNLHQSIATYTVSVSGYPIHVNSEPVNGIYTLFGGVGIASKAELHTHFRTMFENRNSPLIVAIAYLMRAGL